MIRKMIGKIFYKESNKKYSLDAILEHAVKNTMYYANYNSKDLSSFPILTKEILREKFNELKSKDLNRRICWLNTSGGSTGEPTKFIQDNEYLLNSRLTTYEHKNKLGYFFGDKMIKLWGDENEILNNTKSFKSILVNKVKNITFLNSFNMTQEKMTEFVEIINKEKPKLIVAYVNAIYELSKYIEENKIIVTHSCPIMTGAGTVHDFMRATIERVFNTKVYNRYGGREVGNMAFEIPEYEGLKITNDVFIEIIDDFGNPCRDGEEGNIVVTLLTNYAMPLIRYKIGDRGILNKNKYNFPIFEKVTGRIMETFKNNEGKVIPAEYFIHVVGVVFNKKSNWIKKFQIVQKKLDLIIVYIVKYKKETPEDLIQIKYGINKVMSNDCSVEILFVDDIKPLKSGKYVYTLSEVK